MWSPETQNLRSEGSKSKSRLVRYCLPGRVRARHEKAITGGDVLEHRRASGLASNKRIMTCVEYAALEF